MIADILAILFLAVFMACIWLLQRNNNVFVYKEKLNDRCFNVLMDHIDKKFYTYPNPTDFQKEHDNLKLMWDSISNIPYPKMLFSFKQLIDENWLTQEQIDFLNTKFD